MGQNDKNAAIQEAMRLAQTPAGQQLLAMLKQADNQKIQQAMASFSSGKPDEAKKLLADVLSTPQAKRLMEQMGK